MAFVLSRIQEGKRRREFLFPFFRRYGQRLFSFYTDRSVEASVMSFKFSIIVEICKSVTLFLYPTQSIVDILVCLHELELVTDWLKIKLN